MVEFVLVLPFLMLLLFVIVDFAKAYNYWNDSTHLANVAARYAAVGKNPGPSATLEDSIKQQADTDELRNGGGTSGVQGTGAQVCLTVDNVGAGNPVKVTVTSNYKWLPLIGDALPASLKTKEIKSSATMRLEVPWSRGTGTFCST